MTHIRRFRRLGPVLALAAAAACAPRSLVEVDAPSTVVDPTTITTPAGANQLYYFALTQFDLTLAGSGKTGDMTAGAFPGEDNYVAASALFTDELMRAQHFFCGIACIRTTVVDERTGAGSTNYGLLFTRIHQPRVELRQAREALRAYAPASPVAWQGRLYALEAYTVLWFAELFCSGIPLTTVSMLGSSTPTAGFTTQEMLARAVGLFDSAITLSADTARFLNLARVGRGRALLGLGRFNDAAAAVRDVPTDFVYNAVYHVTTGENGIGLAPQAMQIVDLEGRNGLVWSTDPRTAAMTIPSVTGPMLVPAKYSRNAAGVLNPAVGTPTNPVRIADGLEARLIEAEADLAANGTAWLGILNMLRGTCVGAAACAPVPGLTTALLPPLADPGTPNARLDLVMRERAMWLYLTGHRQGDLRRLARVYQREPETLYPTGTYNNPGFPPFVQAASTHGSQYGTDIVFTPHPDEAKQNPLYAGCFNLEP